MKMIRTDIEIKRAASIFRVAEFDIGELMTDTGRKKGVES
jgi:hypothetical protein